jgi:ribosomal protein L32
MLDKGKAVIGGDVPVVEELTLKPPTMRKPPICHHCGLSGHIQLKCPLLKAQRLKVKKEPTRLATSGTRLLAGY